MELFRFNLFSRMKRFQKNYAHNHEMLLIFCSIPNKKIGIAVSPFLISASAQTILTLAENHLLLYLHRKLRRLAIQMQFAAILFQIQFISFIVIAVFPINLQYKLDCGCQLHYLPHQPWKIQKLCVGCR